MAEERPTNPPAPAAPADALPEPPLDAPPKGPSLLRELADKWQLPLLAIGLLLLLTSLPRLLTRPAPVDADGEIAQARQALQDNHPIEAINRVDRLAAAKTTDAQQSQMSLIRGLANHALAALTRDAVQRSHARACIAELDRSLSLVEKPESLDSRLIGPAEFYLKRGQARIWSLDTGEKDLLAALALVSPGQDAMRRQIVELLWNANAAVVHKELDGMLARADLAPADQLWAIRKKTQLLVREGAVDKAEQLLNDYLGKLPAGASQDALEVELARVYYESAAQHGDKLSSRQREAKMDEAYRLLSAVQLRRAPVVGEEETDSELCWLLGEVSFTQNRPVEAEENFRTVTRLYPGTPFTRAAELGIAKSSAVFKPIDRAYEAYQQVVDQLLRGPDDPLIDRRAVRNSLLALAEQLRRQEQWESSYQFLVLLYPMVDPAEVKPSQGDVKEMQGRLLRRLAQEEKQAAERLAREAAQRSPASQPEEIGHLNAQARRHLRLAAEAFLEAAHLEITDDQRSGDDLEIAATCYDEAGEILQAIVVLTKFVRDYPGDQSRVARAVFTLAKSYQGAGQFDRAIAQYQRMISEYANSPDANKSPVPMAQCYKSLGKFEEAEKALTDLLADDRRYSPDSKEYSLALFELAKLKYERRQYRQAIARFDELLQREPASPQSVYFRYHLADSYRLSGIEMDASIAAAKTPLERQQLSQTRSLWLGQAKEHFDQVVAALEARGGESGELSELDSLYLRNAYFFRADCVFDLALYDDAIDLYDLAALKYHGQPEAVAAYVQVVNCYQRLKKPEQARTANERAKWLLKKLSPDTFSRRPLPMGKDYLAQWLEWVSQSGMW
ncbi:MAG: tetratricopeptide repeat protein [Phycisphaerae bacterium]|nr:tetratricopeptide repeat protein [Phycisphaerae bacterium]